MDEYIAGGYRQKATLMTTMFCLTSKNGATGSVVFVEKIFVTMTRCQCDCFQNTAPTAARKWTGQMQKGDVIRARFMTLPSEYPGSGANDEKRFPVRKGAVVYVHPKGRYIVAECGGVRETFFPEEVLT